MLYDQVNLTASMYRPEKAVLVSHTEKLNYVVDDEPFPGNSHLWMPLELIKCRQVQETVKYSGVPKLVFGDLTRRFGFLPSMSAGFGP